MFFGFSLQAEFKDLRLEFSGKTVIGRDVIAGDHSGQFVKPPQIVGKGAVFSNGNYLTLKSMNEKNLPAEKLSVEAVVSLKKAQKWGCITGFFQDNGSYEKGWLLGYNERNWFFALSTGGALQYVHSAEKITIGKAVHLSASFNGTEMKIFVNGKLSSSKKLSGKISYPPQTSFVIGSYKDKDENFPMEGTLYKISLLGKSLENKAAQALAGETAGLIPLALKFKQVPVIRFLSPDQAEMSFVLHEEAQCQTVVKPLGKTVISKGTKHSVIIKGLKHKHRYELQITASSKGKKFESDTFTLENNINFSNYKIKKPAAVSAAAQSLINTGITKGLAALSGAGSDKLAFELAGATDLNLALLSFDDKEAEQWRQNLYKAGIYGSRATVYSASSMDELPIALKTFNFIHCNKVQAKTQNALLKLVKPGGFLSSTSSVFADKNFVKKSIKGLNLVQRKEVQGGGQWNSQYGNGGNTSYTGEELNGLASTDKLKIQWIGKPGGDFGIDRNPRMPAPLAANGRLFHQGMNRMAALDAYNGTILWTLEIPHLRRVNIPRDASNWSTDGQYLYTAIKNQLLVINCKDGSIRGTLSVPQPDKLDWSYTSQEDDRIYGSATLKNSQYSDYWTKKSWYDSTNDASTAKVCSTSFFAHSKKTGRLLWNYSKGLIINTTISFQHGRIYFIECRHPELLKLPISRTADKRLWEQQFLVCLDGKTGKKIYEKAIDTPDGNVVFYMQVSEKGIFVTGSNSKDRKYHITGFDLQGKKRWQNSHGWPGGDHSAHMQHPVIIDDTLYLEPQAYSISDGKHLFKGIGRREGCHIYVGFKQGLLFRGTSRQISIWSKETKKTTTWKRLRPSCWLSMLPANGLILVPEGGAGCSCGGWMETSLGFTPWEVKK